MTAYTVTIATRSGVFSYRADDYDSAIALVAEFRAQERRSRPRERKVGRDRWIFDHPRQRSIYPATVTITREEQS